MSTDNNLQKKCGFCGESIPAGAGRCPYCGSLLEVSFDNNYTIGQPEVPPVNGINAGQTGSEQRLDMQNETVRQQYEPENNMLQGGQGTDGSQSSAEIPKTDERQDTAGSYCSAPSGSNMGQQPGNPNQGNNTYRPYGSNGYRPNYNYSSGPREPLSNGMKVFLTVLFTVLPGIGQLAGIIAAIVFMNSDGDNDRKSFGVALLVASLIMFVISCIGCFVFVLALSQNQITY